MSDKAATQIERALALRVEFLRVDDELRAIRVQSRRRVSAVVKEAARPTLGPLLANGMFYSRGRDKYTGQIYERCPTCGHRIR